MSRTSLDRGFGILYDRDGAIEVMCTLSPEFLRNPVPWSGLLAGVLLLGILPASGFALSMERIATLPGIANSPFPCGDANHNGFPECYGASYFGTGIGDDTLVIFEYEGNNSFARYTYPHFSTVLCFGYSDGESLGEIATENGSYEIRICRSLTRDSFPTNTIWHDSINEGNASYAWFTDLDRDGHQELAWNKWCRGIWLFENVYGNVFETAAVLANNPPYGDYIHFDVGEFDNDRMMELVCGRRDSRDSGVVFVFEALGPDNQYVLSAVCSTASFCNPGIATAHDMDLNGRSEILVFGQCFNHNNDSTGRLAIYEATSHAQYRTVWECRIRYGWFPNGYTIVVGDVDGDQVEEFAVTNGYEVRLFKCVGPADYEQVWLLPIPAVNIKLFDLNADGRCELIVDQGGIMSDTAFVYEDTTGLTQVSEARPTPRPLRLEVRPAIVKLGASARFSGLPESSELSLYSASGQLVRRQATGRSTALTWDLTDQQGRRVPAGTYFAVVRSGDQTARCKLCIVN
jgi:hypothetical protein